MATAKGLVAGTSVKASAAFAGDSIESASATTRISSPSKTHRESFLPPRILSAIDFSPDKITHGHGTLRRSAESASLVCLLGVVASRDTGPERKATDQTGTGTRRFAFM